MEHLHRHRFEPVSSCSCSRHMLWLPSPDDSWQWGSVSNIDDRLCRFRWGILSRQQLEALLMLSGLRSIREFHIPVNRMERVSCMPCNDSFFAFMGSLDSNKNSSSNHLAKQCLVLLSLWQACLGRRFSLFPAMSLLKCNTQGGEAPCQGIHLGLEFFRGLVPIRHGVINRDAMSLEGRVSQYQPSLQPEPSELQTQPWRARIDCG